MAQKHQTAIGGTTTVPAAGTATIVHESDGGEWINLVAFVGSAAGLTMNAYVRDTEAGRIPLVTHPDDGPDEPQGGSFPIVVPSSEGSRFLTLVKLEQGDELVFTYKNTTGNPETVTTFASAAGSIDVALGNGGR